MKIAQPFHDGELRVQARVGERAQADLNARTIGDCIPATVFSFLASLPLLVLGRTAADQSCDLTVLLGAPGFLVASAQGKRLTIALDPSRDFASDPLLSELAIGHRVGSLAIDLTTRRRMRINGRVAALAPRHIELEVDQSFANCPKYIQKRELVVAPSQATPPAAPASGVVLGPEQRAIIRAADTFFVASTQPNAHADASHRGGMPGFVEISEDGELRVPDYAGNSMFNTLGNFDLHDRSALVFWDFERNVLLHLRGRVRLSFDEPDPRGASGGTGRFWYFKPERWAMQSLQFPFVLRLVETSRFNPS